MFDRISSVAQSMFFLANLSPKTNLLHNQSFASHGVVDKYITFHSLDARNLLSTEVRYNYPV